MQRATHDDSTQSAKESAVQDPDVQLLADFIERAKVARRKMLDVDAALMALEDVRAKNDKWGAWCEGVFDSFQEALYEYSQKRTKEALDALEPFSLDDLQGANHG